MKTPNQIMQLLVVTTLISSCGSKSAETPEDSYKNESAIEDDEYGEEGDPSEDVETEEESSGDMETSIGTEDWDQILTDYGDFTDRYIDVVKKSAKGDATALSESGELMQQAQELGDKLESAKDELTSEQMNRMMKIQQKYLKAAQSIEGN